MRIDLRVDLRHIGWAALAAGAAVAGFGLAVYRWDLVLVSLDALQPLRLAETAAPVAAVIQSAFLFSPEDEPALEVFLACPRSPGKILIQRLALAAPLHGILAVAVGLAGLAVVGASGAGPAGQSPLSAMDIAILLTGWMAPAILFAGLAQWVTQASRQAVNGVALGLVLWLGLALAGDALTTRFPFLWPVSPFLHPPCMGCPEAASLAALAQYGVNRVCVALLGVSLFALGARRLQDSQAVLGIGNPRRLETARFETGEKETGRKPTGIPSEPRSL